MSSLNERIVALENEVTALNEHNRHLNKELADLRKFVGMSGDDDKPEAEPAKPAADHASSNGKADGTLAEYTIYSVLKDAYYRTHGARRNSKIAVPWFWANPKKAKRFASKQDAQKVIDADADLKAAGCVPMTAE